MVCVSRDCHISWATVLDSSVGPCVLLFYIRYCDNINVAVLQSERLEFRNEPLNEEFVEEVMRTEAIDVMSQIVGEFRTSSIDGCSANFILNSTVDGKTAECDTSISAVGILTEIDATAVASVPSPMPPTPPHTCGL